MAMRISDRARKQSFFSRRTKVDLICFAVIILVATSFFLTNGSEEDLNWDDKQLLLTVSEDTIYTIPYDQIVAVSLVEDGDFGVCLSGEDTKKHQKGIWQNELLGSYVLYAYPGASPVIHIASTDEDYWIALDNKDTTVAFYEAFLIMLKDAGYSVN